MQDLSSLNIGDYLAVRNRNRTTMRAEPTISYLIYKIIGRTKTQFKADNINNPMQTKTIRIADGMLIGESASTYLRAEPSTPEILAQHKAEKAALIRFRKARDSLNGLLGKELHQLNLTTEQMEHLGKAWAEVQAMGQQDHGSAQA